MAGDVAGLYKSRDQGRHLRLINHGLADYAVYGPAISHSDPQTLYAETDGGLCRTTNGGQDWTLLPQTVPGKLTITSHRGDTVRPIAVDPIIRHSH